MGEGMGGKAGGHYGVFGSAMEEREGAVGRALAAKCKGVWEGDEGAARAW